MAVAGMEVVGMEVVGMAAGVMVEVAMAEVTEAVDFTAAALTWAGCTPGVAREVSRRKSRGRAESRPGVALRQFRTLGAA